LNKSLQPTRRPRAYLHRAFILGLLLAAFILLLGKLPARIDAMEKHRRWEGEVYQFAQLFVEIYADVQERYVEEVDSQKLFEGAIRGMFTGLDPHSQWLSPDSLNQLTKETDGQFSGVGLHITLDKDGILTVIQPIGGTPAAKAGVAPWDRIVEIDGESTQGITLVEAVKKLMGPDGSEVNITVAREGENELLKFTLVRDRIKVESVFSQVIDGDLGYVRIARFSETTAKDVEAAVKEFGKKGVAGLIIDLRYDTGGLLDKAIEISDFFLPRKQLIVSTKGRDPKNDRHFYAENDPITELPLIVLVNRGSASASEIFAGAIQDTGRGYVVGPEGQTTFGKGSVQTISTLRHSLSRGEDGQPQESGLRLTTALYYTPSGRSIHNSGITPDFFVTNLTRDQERSLLRHGLLGDPDTTNVFGESEDPQPGEADAGEGEPSAEETIAAPPAPETAGPFVDVQLQESLQFIRKAIADGRSRIAKN
jgi:carboxyl-terminal processing protease